MKTTLVTAASPFGRLGSTSLACQTWPIISAAVRLRLNPCAPVAQNAQSSAHPTCDEIHKVPRAGSGMYTASTRCPEPLANSHLTVPSEDSYWLSTRGNVTAARSASFARSDFDRSVIA